MKEFVFVEFIFAHNETSDSLKLIKELGDDFVLTSDYTFRCDTGIYRTLSGKINSTAATALKLGNSFLANRMRISYISDDLKDKYRNR